MESKTTDKGGNYIAVAQVSKTSLLHFWQSLLVSFTLRYLPGVSLCCSADTNGQNKKPRVWKREMGQGTNATQTVQSLEGKHNQENPEESPLKMSWEGLDSSVVRACLV